MAEQSKKTMGDGSDNFGSAAKQGAKVAKEFGKNITGQTAKQGSEAVGRVAVAAVKAGAKAGKAVSEIAAGTAAGGPWGAVISAAWSMRHTLFKILICVCLAVLFIIVTVVALPGILVENIVNVFSPDTEEPTLEASYIDLTSIVAHAVEIGHEWSFDFIDQEISDGGYDYELSMANISDNSVGMTDHDISYILSVYSVADMGREFSRDTMIYMLNNLTDKMFPVTLEVKEATKEVTTDGVIEEVKVQYLSSTIHSLDKSVIYSAVSINPDEVFNKTNTTYGQVIEYYTMAFEKMFDFGG